MYILGPVVQSVISLTSSLRVILLTVLADSLYNMLIFFADFFFFEKSVEHTSRNVIYSSKYEGYIDKNIFYFHTKTFVMGSH